MPFLCTMPLAVILPIRQHRTISGWRLCRTATCSFSAISRKKLLTYDSMPASFLRNLTKNLLRICTTIIMRYCLNFLEIRDRGADRQTSIIAKILCNLITSVCPITVLWTVIVSKPEKQALSYLKIALRVMLSRTHYLMSSSFRPKGRTKVQGFLWLFIKILAL